MAWAGSYSWTGCATLGNGTFVLCRLVEEGIGKGTCLKDIPRAQEIPPRYV